MVLFRIFCFFSSLWLHTTLILLKKKNDHLLNLCRNEYDTLQQSLFNHHKTDFYLLFDRLVQKTHRTLVICGALQVGNFLYRNVCFVRNFIGQLLQLFPLVQAKNISSKNKKYCSWSVTCPRNSLLQSTDYMIMIIYRLKMQENLFVMQRREKRQSG